MFFVITSLGVLYFIRYFIRIVNDFQYLVALCFNRFVSFSGLSQRVVQAGAQGVWRDYLDRSSMTKSLVMRNRSLTVIPVLSSESICCE